MKLLSRDQCGERLARVFPGHLVDDVPAAAGPLAAAAVYVSIYCGALEGHNPIRPSTVLWMCERVAKRALASDPDQFQIDRQRWYRATRTGRRALLRLLAEWGIEHQAWYADNSREPLRDETFREWLRLGAMAHDPTLPTTSPKPAWTLRGDFAALFSPSLDGPDLEDAIESWQREHLGVVGRARIRLASEREAAVHSVEVRLPDGAIRALAPGDSSLILKGIIEVLAPRLLGSPGVVAISQSKRKVDVLDDALLRDLRLTVRVAELLPDAVLFDAQGGHFWFVEAVATDGEIHEERRRELIRWAAEHGIQAAQCRFVSGFLSRTHEAFRRRVSRLAWDTYAWFLDEPDKLIKFEQLSEAST